MSDFTSLMIALVGILIVLAIAYGERKLSSEQKLDNVKSDHSDELESLIAHASFLDRAGDKHAVSILARHASRYSMGHMNYGSIEPLKDKRDFMLEMRDELDDALFYIEAELMRDAANRNKTGEDK